MKFEKFFGFVLCASFFTGVWLAHRWGWPPEMWLLTGGFAVVVTASMLWIVIHLIKR
jgi:uncharacterized membrane protein